MERQISNYLNSNKKVINLFLLGRPWNGFLIGFIAITGYFFSASNINLTFGISLFIAFLAVYNAGAILNDIYDYDIDKKNMPYRPLQSEKITVREAKIFSFLLYLISIIISAQHSYFLLGIATFIFFSIIYSTPPIHLVRRHFLANLNLAIVTIFIPSMTGISTGLNSINIPQVHIMAFGALSILFFSFLFLKDLKDIEGDREGSKLTVTLLVGEKNTKLLSGALSAIFFPMSTLFFNNYFINNNQLFFITSTIIFIVLIFITIENNPHKINKSIFEEKRFAKARLLLFAYSISIFLFHF